MLLSSSFQTDDKKYKIFFNSYDELIFIFENYFKGYESHNYIVASIENITNFDTFMGIIFKNCNISIMKVYKKTELNETFKSDSDLIWMYEICNKYVLSNISNQLDSIVINHKDISNITLCYNTMSETFIVEFDCIDEFIGVFADGK